MNSNIVSYIETKILENAKERWLFQNFKFEGLKARPLEQRKYFDFGVIEVFLNSNGSIDVAGDFYRNAITPKEYNSVQDACAMVYDHLRYADQNYHRLVQAPEDWTKKSFFGKLFSGFKKAG
ncbi:hypothetical protein ACNQKP_18350 [Bdellovibrio bacteriovorus]|uniref:hypothetical protein n=1 Tax=Bdellovibrio bacteriovorus TaxID=959 RepID=UPI003AA86F4B